MTDRVLKRLAWSLCALTLLVMASSLGLILLGWSMPLPHGATPWRDQTVSLAGIVGAPILGGLIASRRPRNPYGWVWLGFGLSLAMSQLATSISAYALVEPGTLAASMTISRVLGLGNQVSLALAPFLLLLFPTGRLPSRRWRPVAWISALSGATIVVLVFLFESPDKVEGIIGITAVSVVFVIFATIAVSALSLLFRYRRARGVERQQLKWVAFAAVLAALFLVGQQLFWLAALLITYLVGGEDLPNLNGSLENLLNVAIEVCLYAGVGIAILRYRLYEIDIIINRTLVYGPLTAMLVAVYVGGVVVLEYAFRTLTGSGAQLAVVTSTLLIAALFNPLRRRVQNFIDHLFYRRKYDAAKTLEAFSAKLRDETDIDALNSELLSTVRETVQPEHVSLWLRRTEGMER
jgi:hypothetical protein